MLCGYVSVPIFFPIQWLRQLSKNFRGIQFQGHEGWCAQKWAWPMKAHVCIHPGHWAFMEPKNHPFRKKNDLNQTSIMMFHLNFSGVYIFWLKENLFRSPKTKLDASEFGLFEESSMGRGPLIWNACWTDFEWFRIWIVKEYGLKAIFFESGKILKHNFAEFQDIDIIEEFWWQRKKKIHSHVSWPFFPRHGILRETLEQKDTISDARAKNPSKTCATNTPPKKDLLSKRNRPRKRFFPRVCEFCEENHQKT